MASGDRLFDFFQRSTVLRGQDQTLAQLRQAAPWPWLGAATFTAPQGGVGACTEKITRRVCAGPDDRRSARCPYYVRIPTIVTICSTLIATTRSDGSRPGIPDNRVHWIGSAVGCMVSFGVCDGTQLQRSPCP